MHKHITFSLQTKGLMLFMDVEKFILRITLCEQNGKLSMLMQVFYTITTMLQY